MKIFLTLVFILCATPTALAQVSPEFHLGATFGGGRFRTQQADGILSRATLKLAYGGTLRVGMSLDSRLISPVFAINADMLSMGDGQRRFLAYALAGVFGLRFPLNHGYQSPLTLTLGGLMGYDVANQSTFDGGFTWGGLAGFQLEHGFAEIRYQVFTYTVRYPAASTLQLHQLLLNVGYAY